MDTSTLTPTTERGPVGLLLTHRAIASLSTSLHALADRAWARIQAHRPAEDEADGPRWLQAGADSPVLLPVFEMPVLTCEDFAEANVPGADLERFEGHRLMLSPLTRWSRFAGKGPMAQVPPLLAWLLGEIERRCEDPVNGGLVLLGWKITEVYVELHATVSDEVARAVTDGRAPRKS